MFLFFLVKYLKLTIEKGQRKSTVRALSSLRTPRPLKALVTEVVKIKQASVLTGFQITFFVEQ